MPLAADTRLGPYEIVGPLGKGGMGEVYRARDTKLDRPVAIKTLPAEVSKVPERLARFRREAQLLASLNHPNIASIHGIEEHDGEPFLVLELVEGEDLSERLARGPIPIDEARDVARQVAEALEAAHEKGIVHRDLKPANIKVTPDGTVKVLDFGLAKAYTTESEASGLSQSPTISRQATAAGVILGTAAYMSPEQAKGKRVDKRTDVWAFGAVLYEMLTGRRAFSGEDFSETLAAILKEEPDWSRLSETTPAKVEQLLRRCLRKDAKRRWHDIADARIELEEASESDGVAERQPLASRRGALVWALSASVATGLVVGLAARSLGPEAPTRPVTRTILPLPPGSQLEYFDRLVALSPDGRTAAYIVRNEDGRALYLRPLDSLETRRVPGTEAAHSPTFSPDGRWVAFHVGSGGDERGIAKVSVTGGAPMVMSQEVASRGMEWMPDDTLVYTRAATGLSRISSDGGDAEILTTPDVERREKTHRFPHALPDGKAVVFTDGSADIISFDEASIAILDLETGEQRVLLEGGTSPQYVSSGHLVYARAGTLLAIPFDAPARKITGPPVTVLDDVWMDPIAGNAQFSVSRTGDLLYAPGGAFVPSYPVVRVDRAGKSERLTTGAGRFEEARLSPDETRLAIWVGSANNRIGIYDLSRDTMTRYITGFENGQPIWAPMGARVVFNSNRSGTYNLYWQEADGGAPVERLTTSELSHWPYAWSPDGAWLAFVEQHPETGADIWVLPIDDRVARPLVRSTANESLPYFSADGRFIVYVSDETGQNEIYLTRFPDGGRAWRVSTSGGFNPLWNPNDGEILYRNGDEILAVDADVDAQGVPRLSRPRLLFRLEGSLGGPTDITSDGAHLLFTDYGQDQAIVTHLVLVQNWTEELKRLAPPE